jgi:hypothetical protein
MNAINEEPEPPEIEALLPWYAAGTLTCRSNIAHVSHLSAGLAHSTQANGRKPARHGETHSSTGERDGGRASGGRGRQSDEQDQGTAEARCAAVIAQPCPLSGKPDI